MTSQGECRHRLGTVESRVGRALLCLHRNLQNTKSEESQAEALLSAWQAKWSGRRDQISSRLEVIEAHMERLTQQVDPAPRLAVVGGTEPEVEVPLSQSDSDETEW